MLIKIIIKLKLKSLINQELHTITLYWVMLMCLTDWQRKHFTAFYDGKVSQDRPYRREVANGVLQYVEKIVKTDVNKFNNILFKRKSRANI